MMRRASPIPEWLAPLLAPLLARSRGLRRHAGTSRPSPTGAMLALAALMTLVLLIRSHSRMSVLQVELAAPQEHAPEEQAPSVAPARGPQLGYRELYGGREAWDTGPTEGPSQLLVMGAPGSGASLVVRLLMLMGAWAGEPDQLHFDPDNMLRPWELKLAVAVDYAVHGERAAANLAALAPEARRRLGDRAAGVLRALNHRRPWVLKDPLLSWAAPLYIERLESPMCVVMYRDPRDAAARPHRSEASAIAPPQGDAAARVELWTNATLSALLACVGVPTLVLPTALLERDSVQQFSALLAEHLEAAGVQGLRLPASDIMAEQFMDHMREPGEAAAGTEAEAATEPEPERGGGPAAAAGAGGAVKLPAAAESLNRAIVASLAQTLPAPKAPHRYDRVANRLLYDYQRLLAGKSIA